MSQRRKIARRIRKEATDEIRIVMTQRGLDVRGYSDNDIDRMMLEQIRKWNEANVDS